METVIFLGSVHTNRQYQSVLISDWYSALPHYVQKRRGRTFYMSKVFPGPVLGSTAYVLMHRIGGKQSMRCIVRSIVFVIDIVHFMSSQWVVQHT